jgi:hypothetical protein
MLNRIGRQCVWIRLAQDGVQWWNFMDMIMNFHVA